MPGIAGPLGVTGISPGYVTTEFASNIKNEEVRNAIQQNADQMAIPAEAVARAIAYDIEQPDNVDVGDIVIRPSVQGLNLYPDQVGNLVWPGNGIS